LGPAICRAFLFFYLLAAIWRNVLINIAKHKCDGLQKKLKKATKRKFFVNFDRYFYELDMRQLPGSESWLNSICEAKIVRF